MAKKQLERFAVGDQVEWTSQSAGTWKKKCGTVVEVVPPNAELSTASAIRLAQQGFGLPRNHESYVVRVYKPDGRYYRIYWPRVSNLKRKGE